MFRLTDEQVNGKCGLGKGEGCCRYLTVGKDFLCAKSSPDMRETLDKRFEQGMNAKGDNCSGPDRLRFIRDTDGGFMGSDSFKAGDIVYAFHGYDYGCLGPNEIGVMLESGKYPFIGVPSDSVEKVPFDDPE